MARRPEPYRSAVRPAGRGALRAAGRSDVGRQRDVNEDRLHIDAGRGIFIVVDGVGGQAAGGRAADIAIRRLRERLERQTGPTADRVREAIAVANNAIYREAAERPEWRGMACVLTVAVVDEGRAVIGHVGDTRLYLAGAAGLEKITPDHSPVGEREDARELSEFEAMSHPRRNEVFRDVGSASHEAGDADFMFVGEIDFPPDASLLLCSDGLTDLVPLRAIGQVVETRRGQPDAVVNALVQAANDAGGKDNITVVYVEGPGVDRQASMGNGAADTERLGSPRRRRASVGIVVAAALLVAGLSGWWAWEKGWIGRESVSSVLAPLAAGPVVVAPGESIAAAIERARPGDTVVVEPGEYRERLTLRSHVRVVSRESRAAIIRLPGVATEQDAAVVAAGATNAELVGFRIVGDAASPLGTGVLTRDAQVRLVDLDITGATVAGIDIGAGEVTVIGADIHDNPGAAIVVKTGASARVVHNALARNATSERAVSTLVVEEGARPVFSQNVFHGADAQALSGIDAATLLSLPKDNWFIHTPAQSSAARGARGGPAR